MSLDWNAKALTARGQNIWTADPGKSDDDQVLNPVTESLIWATIPIGAFPGEPKFAERLRAWEIALGPLVRGPRPEYRERAVAANYIRENSLTDKGYISKAEIDWNAGLKTNADRKTDAQFAKALAQAILDRAESSLRLELKKPI